MATYAECGYWPVTDQKNLGTCDGKNDDVWHAYDMTKWPYRKDCPDSWRTVCGRRAGYKISHHSLTDVNCAACHREAVSQGYGKIDSRNGTVYREPKRCKKSS